MEDIVKIAAVALITVLCAVVTKKHVPEIGIVISVLGVALIALYSLNMLASIKNFIAVLAETAGISPTVIEPVIKTVGIAMITKFAAEICKDAKEGGVAALVETVGAAAALIVCFPLVETVLSMVQELL